MPGGGEVDHFRNVGGVIADAFDILGDEQQMGASYPELEWAMGVADSHTPADFEGRQREVLEIYLRLNRAMQHKVQPIPVCHIPQEWLI